MVKFGDHVLGKGVVIAKDTPNFIANHVGLYGVARTLDALATGKYTIEEIDAITGPALGRPGKRDVPDDGYRRHRRARARARATSAST
jgi:3-hydroxyacyl-CoA dehydrogenase